MAGEMVERVARAIRSAAEAVAGQPSFDPRTQTVDERVMARAAIEAMREPTEAMRNAPMPDCFYYGTPSPLDAWGRMIDAVLKEQETT